MPSPRDRIAMQMGASRPGLPPAWGGRQRVDMEPEVITGSPLPPNAAMPYVAPEGGSPDVNDPPIESVAGPEELLMMGAGLRGMMARGGKMGMGRMGGDMPPMPPMGPQRSPDELIEQWLMSRQGGQVPPGMPSSAPRMGPAPGMSDLPPLPPMGPAIETELPMFRGAYISPSLSGENQMMSQIHNTPGPGPRTMMPRPAQEPVSELPPLPMMGSRGPGPTTGGPDMPRPRDDLGAVRPKNPYGPTDILTMNLRGPNR